MAFRGDPSAPAPTPTLGVPAGGFDIKAALKDYQAQNPTSGSKPLSRTAQQQARTVWLDHTYRSTGKLIPLGENGTTRQGRKSKGLIEASVTAARGDWYTWDDAKRNAFASQAFALGRIRDPADLDSARSLWHDLVEESANFASHGKKVTPQQVMVMYAGGNASGKKALGPLGADGLPLANRTVVTKNRSVNITDPLHAKAIIQNAFQQSMGRDATSAEIRAMSRSLLAQEQANPSLTSQSQQYNALGNPTSTSSSVTSGGFDETSKAQYVSDQTKADPESGAYQAATTYMSGLLGILKSGL